MIDVYEKGGVWYAECSLDDFHSMQVNTAEPEYLTVLWKSDRHVVYRSEESELFGERKIYYYRLFEVMELKRKWLENKKSTEK